MRDLDSSPAALAQTFLAGARADACDLGLIDRLCALSFHPEPAIARAATQAIFSGVIEPLCDDFSLAGVEAANLTLAHILSFIREQPPGSELDSRLRAFGFASAADLRRRHQTICQPHRLSPRRLAGIKRALILSRVTAGADIAITSVIVNRLRQRLPEAELVLIGPGHLRELFATLPGCRHRSFIYHNDGFLFDKMTSWPPLLKIAQEELAGLAPNQALLFDPDTRLTQLGLLPLAPDEGTCYFPSRRFQPVPGGQANLSALTNQWLNHLLDEDIHWRPRLALGPTDAYAAFRQRLRDRGCRRLVAVNFGVGKNPRKRVGGGFEAELILALLKLPDTVVLLDTGRSDQRGERLADHLHRARQGGWQALWLREEGLASLDDPPGQGLIVFSGPLGALGKMIGAADCFIGYDSCGQHLAAATGTPSVIVFAGAPSERFVRRWAPEASDSLTIPHHDANLGPEAIAGLIANIRRHLLSVPNKQQVRS